MANRFGISDEIFDGIVSILKRNNVKKAQIFGSRARGDWRDSSDIDLAIWLDDSMSEAEVWQELEQLPTIHKIDLVNYPGISDTGFAAAIERDGVDIV
ncbi:MAG: nucleotidyltransferase domain-containing protein [Candidatus Nomurabacteria bacterium]|nr:nucleotidyltransferase domain-containing protein [Candidatus Nomurabacteria bacterium]